MRLETNSGWERTNSQQVFNYYGIYELHCLMSMQREKAVPKPLHHANLIHSKVIF